MRLLFLTCLLIIAHSIVQTQQSGLVNQNLIIDWDDTELTEFFGEAEVEFWPEQELNYIDQESLWNVINRIDLALDDQVRGIFIYGIEYFLDWGVTEGVLESETEYSLESINMIQQNQANESLYYFDVTFIDNQTHLERLGVVIYEEPGTNKTVTNTTFAFTTVLESEPNVSFLDQTWSTSLTCEQFQNNERNIQNIFLFGLNSVIALAIQEGVLKNQNYYVDTLYAAPTSPGLSQNYYLLDAFIYTQTLGGIEVVFTVLDDGQLQLEKYLILKS